MQGDIELGHRIRKFRKNQRITLKELAQSAELSISFISQVERGRISPSIAALKKIAKALGIKMADFFDEEMDQDHYVVRKDKRKTLLMPHKDVTYQLLSPDLVNKTLEFTLITINPKIPSSRHPLTHDGEEYGLVIKGQAKITIGTNVYILSEGDSIWFPADQPHSVEGYGESETMLAWVLTPPGWQ